MEQGLKNVLWFFARVAIAIIMSALIIVSAHWTLQNTPAAHTEALGFAVSMAATTLVCGLAWWALWPILHKK